MTQFDVSVHERMDQLQVRLLQIKEKAAPPGSAIDYSLETAEERIKGSRKRLEHAQDVMDDWIDTKLDTFEAWRENKQVDKLIAHGAKSQRHAEAALDVALNAMDEAEMALAQAAIAEQNAQEISRSS